MKKVKLKTRTEFTEKAIQSLRTAASLLQAANQNLGYCERDRRLQRLLLQAANSYDLDRDHVSFPTAPFAAEFDNRLEVVK